MKDQLTETSKFLSYILRHKPEAIGLKLDVDGWANISTLIEYATKSGKTLTRSLLQTVVDANDKKRFAISEDGQHIRAVQGHSTQDVSIAYAEKHPPEFLYHGTATRFLESIKIQGLSSGARHYVHLSEDMKTAMHVGQRYGKPIVLKIQALIMYEQGFKFYQAENKVWLTDHVPSRFLISIMTNNFIHHNL